MAPSSPSPDRNSIPDAAGLVIAAKEESYDDLAAANTPGRQQNMAGHEPFWNRDRSGSSSGSINPHEYDRNRDKTQRSLEEQRDQIQPPRSVGFWDPSLREVRKTVISQWAAMSESCLPRTRPTPTSLNYCRMSG